MKEALRNSKFLHMIWSWKIMNWSVWGVTLLRQEKFHIVKLWELSFHYLTIYKHSKNSKNKIVSDKHPASDFAKTMQTRMHSSRMRTARALTYRIS